MSLIERAAKRLEELRLGGADMPSDEQVLGRETQHPAKKANTQFANEAPTSAQTQLSQDIDASTTGLLNTPPVELDLRRLASEGFVTPDNPRSRIAGEFRNLKRTLIINASGKTMLPVKDGNFVMVTSSLPGEGKTFSTINLALSIAMELDSTILLVDADVARPSFPQVLGIPPMRGLLDILQNPDLDLDDVLVNTNVKKLTLLTSGTPQANATELLASDAMTQLLERIARRYPDRIVLFDSPPLLATTESRVLASHMGQIVFVVKAESTLRHDVLQGLAMIESCPVKMMLLNQISSAEQDGAGYGYAYGADEAS